MASWLLLSLLASEEAAPARAPKVRPAWQSRLRTTSIASAARRLGASDWNELTQGNKIVLPPSVRGVLESRGLPFTQFQIANPEIKGKRLYTGPLDFCAAEGECYLPSWAEGGTCAVATAVFPKAIFAKFQPHSSAFLDVADHYMLLMRTLEQYAALTKGSTIRVTDGKRVYDLDVLEVKAKEPKAGRAARDDSRGRAVDTTYTELVVDFHSPKDQEKPKPRAKKAEEQKSKDAEAPEPPAASAAPPAASAAPSAESAAPNAKKPVPKFKRRKAAESAPVGSEAAASRKPRFVGTARTLGSSGDEADASALGADALSDGAKGAQLGAKRLGAKRAGARKAAVARTLAPRADAKAPTSVKAPTSAEHEGDAAVARPSLLQQLIAMLVRVLAWLGSALLALFAPKEVRHDVRS